MSASPPPLHVLTGPTAVGKTAWALAWAEAHGAEIVSCDSLLFYRGLDIGTAKPTREELARVPHHLIDVCPMAEAMDVAHYVELVRTAIEAIAARGRSVLVTGGSGFYLQAFFRPVTDGVAVPPALRRELADRLEREGLPALVAELRHLNDGEVGGLDLANPRRVLRALERCRASGRTLRDLREAFAAMPGPFANREVRCVRLDRPRAELDERIARRVEMMLADGLVAEVERARGEGIERNPSAARAIGYRETLAMLDGRLPGAELPATIIRHTRLLARKQLTWFRHQLPPHPVWPADGDPAGLDFTAVPPGPKKG